MLEHAEMLELAQHWWSTETDGVLKLTVQAFQAVNECQVQWKTLLRKQDRGQLRKTTDFDLWPPYDHMYICTHLHKIGYTFTHHTHRFTHTPPHTHTHMHIQSTHYTHTTHPCSTYTMHPPTYADTYHTAHTHVYIYIHPSTGCTQQ